MHGEPAVKHWTVVHVEEEEVEVEEVVVVVVEDDDPEEDEVDVAPEAVVGDAVDVADFDVVVDCESVIVKYKNEIKINCFNIFFFFFLILYFFKVEKNEYDKSKWNQYQIKVVFLKRFKKNQNNVKFISNKTKN